MSENQPRPVSNTTWALGFLLFPYGPFVCLWRASVISTLEAAFALFSSVVAHAGIVSVLVQINGERLQIFITLLMGVSMLALGFWIFWAGQRKSYWSVNALKQWRMAACLFGGLMVAGLALNILGFHLMRLLKH